MSNNITLTAARDELRRQRDAIDGRLAELDRIERHLFPPVREIRVASKAVDAEAVAKLVEARATEQVEQIIVSKTYMIGAEEKITKRGPLKGYQKANEIHDGELVVGFIARARQGTWDALDTSFEKLGRATTKGKAMQLVADHDQPTKDAT